MEKIDELIATFHNYAYFTNLGDNKKNVITRDDNLNTMSTTDILDIIKQYSIFSNEAIHMLVDSAIRNHDWKILKNEILENIREELGSETLEIPHLELMREGYREELLFDPDKVEWWDETTLFINRMKRAFRNDDNFFSAGAIYSFEYLAIQEFHIIEKLFFKYLELTNANLDLNKSLVYYYIRGHKEFEIGHSEHLLDSIKPYLSDASEEDLNKFSLGFASVTDYMSRWWDDLSFHLLYKINFVPDIFVSKDKIFKKD